MRILDRCPTLVQAAYEDVHVLVWRAPLDDDALERSLVQGFALAKTIPSGKLWAVNVVASGLSMPSLAQQRRASEVARTIDPVMLGAAVVLPGEGFWVSAARAFLIGIDRLVALEMKREVVATIPAAARSIARRAKRSDAWADGLAAAYDRTDFAS